MNKSVVKKGQFVPIDQLPVVRDFRDLLTKFVEGLPLLVEHIVNRDLVRLQAIIEAKINALPEPDRTLLKEAFDGAMERKRDAGSSDTVRPGLAD